MPSSAFVSLLNAQLIHCHNPVSPAVNEVKREVKKPSE
jgi:hypothetical protein